MMDPKIFEWMGGVRTCKECDELFVGPAHIAEDGWRTCLQCRPMAAGSELGLALTRRGYGLDGRSVDQAGFGPGEGG